MKILVIDTDRVGLPFSLRCLGAGHTVRLWFGGRPTRIGEGLVDVVAAWEPSMPWADLIILTDNSKYGASLEPYFTKGFPIIGANRASAALELDREVGISVLEKAGIATLPFEVFTSYDKAIDYVKKTKRTYVSKPWGGNPDKSLSYVSKSPADMVFKLGRWRDEGLKGGKFLLQECVDGTEMAVGGWFGPGGWCGLLNENWEEKRLMNDGLGPNTGEMGTVMRYVKKSALFEEVLEPCTDALADLGYVGYVDMNCMVGEDGTPWPLEFTMRFGWPHFNLCMALHERDPAEYLGALLEGRDRLRASSDVCVGVVMLSNFPVEDQSGYPITGLTPSRRKSVALTSVMRAPAPVMVGEEVVDKPTFCTAGDYVCVATGCGPTVEAARESAYAVAWEIDWPTSRMFRTDLGCRMKEGLAKLQSHGFAKGMKYA